MTLLLLRGPLVTSAAEGWRQFDACGLRATCRYNQDAILRYKDLLYATWTVTTLPFLVAAWAGASLIGRELETGTVRLAWTIVPAPAGIARPPLPRPPAASPPGP
ncbi:hypothetical protein HZZ00_19350 [Streptomyces sp. NEAU-sy36]|uniref:hypothetical protein n=1 Tax=unclassified Streptomyces TaxID=2593676 RepID=UPI0015D59E52|nr:MULTISPECIES: hypothetical protein [unclassified Streptomyces]QLJ02940.1 hypothetical protein HZZ00_19350 [Streptomyces sp. NEAU-sy36]